MNATEQISRPVATTPRRECEIARTVLAHIFERHGPREFAVRLWDGTVLPGVNGAASRWTLVLNHPGALRRMFLPPGQLSVAEAYLRGDFDLEGDMVAAMVLATAVETLGAADWLRLARLVMALPATPTPEAARGGRQPAQLRGRRHSRERDRAAVTYHYDVGNDFYALFLGPTMAYSCAYFPTPETGLDAAQAAKFEHICRKLRLRAGERLLDIGCGWGGLVLHAARHHGVQAVGITLSPAQADLARERVGRAGLAERVRIEVRDYRDVGGEESFDKIASVGMVEHVGRGNLPVYFASAFRALRPGGLFLNHGITDEGRGATGFFPDWVQRTFFQRGQFFQRYVFPDGGSWPIDKVLSFARRAGFEICDVEGLRPHYALTARHWIRNLEARHDEAVRLRDERTFRIWRLYLAAGVQNLELGRTGIFQALLAKSWPGPAAVPLTRDDLYCTAAPATPRAGDSAG